MLLLHEGVDLFILKNLLGRFFPAKISSSEFRYIFFWRLVCNCNCNYFKSFIVVALCNLSTFPQFSFVLYSYSHYGNTFNYEQSCWETKPIASHRSPPQVSHNVFTLQIDTHTIQPLKETLHGQCRSLAVERLYLLLCEWCAAAINFFIQHIVRSPQSFCFLCVVKQLVKPASSADCSINLLI